MSFIQYLVTISNLRRTVEQVKIKIQVEHCQVKLMFFSRKVCFMNLNSQRILICRYRFRPFYTFMTTSSFFIPRQKPLHNSNGPLKTKQCWWLIKPYINAAWVIVTNKMRPRLRFVLALCDKCLSNSTSSRCEFFATAHEWFYVTLSCMINERHQQINLEACYEIFIGKYRE